MASLAAAICGGALGGMASRPFDWVLQLDVPENVETYVCVTFREEQGKDDPKEPGGTAYKHVALSVATLSWLLYSIFGLFVHSACSEGYSK